MAEFDRFLAGIVESENDPCLLAVVVGPFLAGAETQARLQAVDLLAPGRERLFFLLLLWLFLGLLHFEFELPSGELAQRGVEFEIGSRCACLSKHPLVLN